MQTYGLQVPTAPSAAVPPAGSSMSVGGIVPVMSQQAVLNQRQKALDAAYQDQQSQPLIGALAGHITEFWHKAEAAKQTVEREMLEAMLARRGEYTQEKRQQIAASNQPEIYMMLAASKMRQVEALLRDVLIGTGTDKPWTLRPTPSPELPPMEVNKIVQALTMEIEQAMSMGLHVTIEDARARLRMYREQLEARLREEAMVRCERTEQKMEDQLVEGCFLDALDAYISDFATFRTAFMKGPVVRKKAKLSWGESGELQVTEDLKLEWERVDPFNIYPAPWARHIGEGPLIERHRLTREELTQLIGVEGYSEPAIRKVLDLHGTDGLHNWLSVDSTKAHAEGKDQLTASTGTGLIDALQYWGSASGKMLLDWGMEASQIEDPAKEYHIEAWLIGETVIKAVTNADPLARRPYYADSFQRIPGSIWGNSVYDLMKDCQDMCNAAARALAANLGISSGPQVAFNVDRMPSGEDLTEMYPWKIWQFTNDPMGGSGVPITFFQPQSNAQELMGVYERFSAMADEYTGIPRYMTGGTAEGGAGRTASGMSMMLSNASKIIKQAVGSIDTHVLKPMLERLYYYNMRYGDDPDLKGDVAIMARGAMSLQTKETAQVRANEFLAATANPFDLQIIGMEGRAEVLRKAAQNLDMNTDKIVPPVAILKERAAMQMMAQQQAAMQGGQGGSELSGSGQELEGGAPVTDNYTPQGSP